jgi:enoyl-CoA hydratase/carnithine racemase
LNLVAARCDIPIAGALFGMPEVSRETIELTTPFALEGLSRVFLSERFYAGDPVAAQRAYEAGLINAVVPDEDVMSTAVRMAERSAQHSPPTVRATKLNLLKTFAAPPAVVVWE